MVDGLNFKAYRAKVEAAFQGRAFGHETIDQHYRAGRSVKDAVAAIRDARRAHKRPKAWQREMWSDPLDHDYSTNG